MAFEPLQPVSYTRSIFMLLLLVSSVVGDGEEGSSQYMLLPSTPSCDNSQDVSECHHEPYMFEAGFEVIYTKDEGRLNCMKNNSMVLHHGRSLSIACTSASEINSTASKWIAPDGTMMDERYVTCTASSIIMEIDHTVWQEQLLGEGVYTCRLNVNSAAPILLHIGIYEKHQGPPIVQVPLQIDMQTGNSLAHQNNTVLFATCTSAHSPAYNVTWLILNSHAEQLTTETHGNFVQSQFLTRGTDATYENVLKWLPKQVLFSRHLTLECTVSDSESHSTSSNVSFIVAPPTPRIVRWEASNFTLTWALNPVHRDTQLFVDNYELRLLQNQFFCQQPPLNITLFINKTEQNDNVNQVEHTVERYTFEDLNDDGSSYRVQIKARNALSSSNWSTPYHFVTTTTCPTGAPMHVSADAINSSAIYLSWSHVECSQRNGQITEYTFQFKEDSWTTFNSTLEVEAGSTFEYTVTDLLPSTRYNFRVAAMNEAGMGPYSQTVNETTLDVLKVTPMVSKQITIIASSAAGSGIFVVMVICIATVLFRCRKHHRSNKVEIFHRSYRSSSDDIELTETAAEDNDYSDPTLEVEDFPEDMVATTGEYVILYANVSGFPRPTLNWYHNDENVITDHSIEVSDDGTLSIPSMESRHIGTYRLEANNGHCRCYRELDLTMEEEEKSNLEKTASLSVSHMIDNAPVPQASFEQYVESHHAQDNNAFQFQYMCLFSNYPERSLTVGTMPENRVLNRFKNIVPYDDNRISLQPFPGCDDMKQDYINASYISGHNTPNKFIATQGPLPHTVADFWHLVWQEHTLVIVMLCNLVEGHRVRCQQYWPDSGVQTYGPFSVQLIEEFKFADYIIRSFEVSLTTLSEAPRKVKHYQFISWPDHLTPNDAGPLLALRRRALLQYDPEKGPILVHCSAGVGRTGTFIALDRAMEQARMDEVVDIMGIVNSMRQQRMKMVQTLPQYIFIYDSVLEALVCGETQITATNLRVALRRLKRVDVETGKSGFEKQFQVLQKITPKPADVNRKAAMKCSDLNRSLEFLPSDRGRVVLHGGSCSYIHATFIDGYKHKKSFIITQGPLKDTCREFWKMAYDYGCGVIVMLSGLTEYNQEVCYQYWPDGGYISFEEYTVELVDEVHSVNLITRQFNLIHSKSDKAIQVTQFQVFKWTPDGQCANYTMVVKLLDDVLRVQRKTGNNPIVVHCSDTVSRSAIFCAVMSVIERCKTEGIVDVFQVVKAIRMQKPGAILSVEQYSFIFDIVVAYLDSMETYSNFKH